MTTSRLLADRLMTAQRGRQLQFLASVIHELTVAARSCYDQPDRHERMMQVNEAIHRISGHLRDLTDPQEPMTTSRAEGVVANANVLHPDTLSRILAYSPL